jgi:hypothetical protein
MARLALSIIVSKQTFQATKIFHRCILSPMRIRDLTLWIALAALALIPTLREAFTLFDSSYGVKALVGLLEALVAISVLTRHRITIPATAAWLCVAWLAWSALAVVAAEHGAVALVRYAEWFIHMAFGYALFVHARIEPASINWILRVFLGGFILFVLSFMSGRPVSPDFPTFGISVISLWPVCRCRSH